MNIFINDHHIQVLSLKEAKNKLVKSQFTTTIDAKKDTLKAAHLQGKLLIINATILTTEKLFGYLNKNNFDDLIAVTIVAHDKTLIKKKIKKLYTIINAAGGIVTYQDKILMMFRRGVWDLPKGKLDNDEKSQKAATREVEEETGVKAKIGDKICTTWHTYNQGRELILKRTKWYAMSCQKAPKLVPQTEEDIEKLEWMTPEEVAIAVQNSYASLRFVIEEWNSQQQALSKKS
jgi:8-oxo-dGTP pyrophosphatase MutT (NUDIX family)